MEDQFRPYTIFVAILRAKFKDLILEMQTSGVRVLVV